MAKFIYLYRGPATPMADSTPEQAAERMAAFGAWMEKVGAALVDVGSPFGASASVAMTDRRSSRRPDRLHDRRGRRSRCGEGVHRRPPFLADRDGKHAVEIFEFSSL